MSSDLQTATGQTETRFVGEVGVSAAQVPSFYALLQATAAQAQAGLTVANSAQSTANTANTSAATALTNASSALTLATAALPNNNTAFGAAFSAWIASNPAQFWTAFSAAMNTLPTTTNGQAVGSMINNAGVLQQVQT